MAKWKKPKGRQTRWAKRHLINKYGSVCQLGQHPLPDMHAITLDHIIPKSAGGGNDIDNLQLACAQHNRAKGSMSQAEWLELQGC